MFFFFSYFRTSKKKICFIQKSNDQRQNDAPRWFENPQFLYIPPVEYQSYSIETDAVFSDPWEDYYEKQLQTHEQQQHQPNVKDEHVQFLDSSDNQSTSHDQANWSAPPDNSNHHTNIHCSENATIQDYHVEPQNYEEHSVRDYHNVQTHSQNPYTERRHDSFDSNNNASQEHHQQGHNFHQHHSESQDNDNFKHSTTEFSQNIEIIDSHTSSTSSTSTSNQEHSIKNIPKSESTPEMHSLENLPPNQPNIENVSAHSGNIEQDSTSADHQVGNCVLNTKQKLQCWKEYTLSYCLYIHMYCTLYTASYGFSFFSIFCIYIH